MKRIILFLIIILFSCKLERVPIENKIQDESFELISLQNDMSKEGKAYLFTSFVEDKEYYFAYIKTNDGITRLKIPTENIYIIETKEMPSFRLYYDYSNTIAGRPSEIEDLQYDLYYTKAWFYVPIGTIIRKIEIN